MIHHLDQTKRLQLMLKINFVALLIFCLTTHPANDTQKNIIIEPNKKNWKIWVVQSEAVLFTKPFVLCGAERCEARSGVCALSGAVRLPKRVARRRKNGPHSDSARRALIFHCPVGDDTRTSLFPLRLLSNSLAGLRWLAMLFFPFSFRRTRGYWFPHLLWHIAEMIFIAVSARASLFFAFTQLSRKKWLSLRLVSAHSLCELRVCFAG
jgi:hypothetical protein